VSSELCVGPIEADAPVITHVSVEKTDSVDGKIRVSWRSPFNINTTQFPKPYEYEVYRASGFIGDTSIMKAGRVSDTTFVDSGINTDQNVFNYRVVLYAKPDNATQMIAVDTSSIASSVRLSFTAGVKKIELAWRDSVPWSNVAQSRPYHLIYRSIESPLEKDMVLIDSVEVSEEGFTYVDVGRYQNQALQDDKRYSYRVLTRGTYGNPKIALQENYSQIITTYPTSDLKPCRPNVEIKMANCDEYLNANTCYQTEFSNTIFRNLDDLSGCRKDIVTYKIYATSSQDGDYALIKQIASKNTFFIEAGLPSFARCYRISAIDGLDQEGPLSDSVCNDNCPYYELPNVFTPNEDGYNDAFSANFDVKDLQNGTTTSGVSIRCPRFVQSIDFTVYNRWGKQVYSYTSEDENFISIEWNGHDSNGHELSSGVYFYTAEVTFNVLRAENKKRQLQGWVHLVR
jgi:CHU_C Type IX secretion signal domain